MIKFLVASIAAAFALGIAFDLFGTGAEVMASSSQIARKGDRLDNPSTETVCGEWPFYHHTCSHDLKNSDGRARKLRIISRASQQHRTFLTLLSK
jgi:hypothetical protein